MINQMKSRLFQRLLALLDITGCIVTIEHGFARQIARRIINQGGVTC